MVCAAHCVHGVWQAVQRFVVADLSNWYLDVAKDRLYVRAAGSADRRACQTVMHALLQARRPALAPRSVCCCTVPLVLPSARSHRPCAS